MGATKLGGRVREGRWIGMDDESKGARIYWPDSKTVMVERNITYDNTSASHFEEEIEVVSVNKMTTDLPTQPTNNVAPNINVEDSDVKLSKRI